VLDEFIMNPVATDRLIRVVARGRGAVALFLQQVVVAGQRPEALAWLLRP